MTWMFFALKNPGRRKLRSGVTLLGVAVAIAALFSLLSFQRGYQAGIRQELDRLGAHVLVVPKGCPYDAASIALHGANWPCYLKETYLEQVKNAEGVESAAPLLMNAINTEGNAVYLGADESLLKIKRDWKIEGVFPKQAKEYLLGSQTAQTLKAKLGDTVSLPGLPGEQGRVVGILAPTQGADDTFCYMSLAEAQRIFKRPKQLTHLLVRLKDPDALDQVVGALRGCEAGMEMNIVPLTHLFHTIQGLVNSTRVLLGCIVLVALLVAGAGVANTILMAVTERVREIGVLRAVGASHADIFRLIWLETVLLCLVGGVLGIGIAILGAKSLEEWLRQRLPFTPSDPLVRLEPGIMLLCLGGALLLGTVSGLIPAWRASRLSPVEAIRTGANA